MIGFSVAVQRRAAKSDLCHVRSAAPRHRSHLLGGYSPESAKHTSN